MSTKTEKERLKKKVFAYHLRYPETKFYKYHAIDPEFPKHHKTIERWVHELKNREENGDRVENVYRNKINRENAAVFQFLEDDTEETITIITLLRTALKKKAIKAEDDQWTNIKDVATSLAIVIDKEIALNRLNNESTRLEMDRERLNLEYKKLEFEKEKLETKIANPEAFAPTVTIINDAPHHDKPVYKELIKDESN